MNHEQNARTDPDAKPVELGGWLILPALGLLFGIIRTVNELHTMTGLKSDLTEAGYGGVATAHIAAGAGFLALLIYAAARFFGKKTNAPTVMILLYATMLGVPALLLLNDLAAGADEVAAESGKSLALGAVNAAIWIPYFKLSKRVKRTFVN